MPTLAASVLVIAVLCASAVAQQASPPATAPADLTAEQDHRGMMDLLGIKALRPGPSGNDSAPNHANYDEALANPYPDLPDVLTLKNGTKVTTADQWWRLRRPEIAEDMAREVYGRVPRVVPKVTWTAQVGEREFVGRTAVSAKQLVGHVDNASYPRISVDIAMTVVVPANAAGPVPLLMMFGRSAGRDSTKRAQLLDDGWGYALIDPASIQADNGAGLTRGIIGLVNHGQPRRPDDWGALRAWAWGAARGLDYLETDSRGRCEARGYRRRVALRQGGARGARLRAPVRHGAHRLVGQGWRDAASSQLG